MEHDLNLEIIKTSLYLKKEKVLVISDLHLGYEEMLMKSGVLLPKFQLNEILIQLEDILKQTGKLNKVVITGDIKHEFGTISEQEWREILKLFDFLQKNADEIVMIKGNHDIILEPIAEKRNIIVEQDFTLGDYFITHGDEIKETKSKTIIIGHEHPAIVLREENRAEKFKCFLVGKYKKHTLIVLPSFNPLIEGTDILSGETLSPYLDQNLDNFSVYVVGDKSYYFDKLKRLRDNA